jgi:hypothetical protein
MFVARLTKRLRELAHLGMRSPQERCKLRLTQQGEAQLLCF